MDELISRQSVIDMLDETKRIARQNVDGAVLMTFERVLDSLVNITNALPTIQHEPHWIPVTERLPEEDGSYLVSGKWGSGKEAVGDCLFSVEDGYFQTAWNFDVLAWCELPEPYKGVTT